MANPGCDSETNLTVGSNLIIYSIFAWGKNSYIFLSGANWGKWGISWVGPL